MSQSFDRASQDVGNIIALEHVNTTVPDQSQAHLFYVTGMGFTRDPYIDFGMRNMWVNLGRQQFHLPLGEPQVLRGATGIVVPSLAQLAERLERVAPLLPGSRLAWETRGACMQVTCPWGNRLEVFEAGAFGEMRLGMPYVRFQVPEGAAAGIVGFYRQALRAPAQVVPGDEGPVARVSAGAGQTLEYRESSEPLADYDGHHIAVYVADFSGPHAWLVGRGLLSEESNASQYRFRDIVDPDSGDALFRIEHEVRSLCHPMYARALVNRNPLQNNRNYEWGRDAL
jgi:hypothetical protein